MKCQWIVFAVLSVVVASANPEGSSSVHDPDIALPNSPPLPLPPKDPRTDVPATFQVPVIRNTNQPATSPPSPPLNLSPQKKESASTSASQDTFREALTETNSNSSGKNMSISSTDGKAILSATTPPSQEQVKELSSSTAVTLSSTSEDTFREVITTRNTGTSSSEVNAGEGLDNTLSSHHSGSSGEVEVSTGSAKTPVAGTSANDGGNDGGVKIPGRNGETGAVATNGSDTSATSRAAASVLLVLMSASCMYAAL